MKALIFALIAMSSVAEASVATCLIKGYVQLDYVTSDWVEGRIGNDWVGLAYYQNYLYGFIKGEEIHLSQEDDTVSGTVGKFNVRWYTDGNHIFGYQSCLLVIPEHKN